FDTTRRVASGPLGELIEDVLRYLVRVPDARLALFDDATGELVDLDWAGGPDEVLRQVGPMPLSQAPPPSIVPERRPGRPRLGVVAREVTLLPDDWKWLNEQPGGASLNLRKLVAEAREAALARERARRAQEAAYRFVMAMAND